MCAWELLNVLVPPVRPKGGVCVQRLVHINHRPKGRLLVPIFLPCLPNSNSDPPVCSPALPPQTGQSHVQTNEFSPPTRTLVRKSNKNRCCIVRWERARWSVIAFSFFCCCCCCWFVCLLSDILDWGGEKGAKGWTQICSTARCC